MKYQNSQSTAYDLKSIKLPYLSGFPLRLITRILESPLRGLLVPSLLKNAGLTEFRKKHVDDSPTLLPIAYAGSLAAGESFVPQREFPKPSNKSQKGFHFATVTDYAAAYRDDKTTPTDIALKVLEAIESSEATEPPLRAFIAVNRDDVLQQAEAATKRLKNGRPLSIFDGVPVAVKDELDLKPYPTTVGTAFMGTTPATEDATIVARMRTAGALLIGKANMHEIGIGVTGLNPHHGTPRNPYNLRHYTGGSSSGAAAAVAAGICPVALGADGGGSIRIPSSFCGLVGLKSTFGRMSEFGAAPLAWSVAHVGPIATTTTDIALTYAIIAGADLRDPFSLHQPIPKLDDWDNIDLSDLTLGVYWQWFRHANADVVSACEAMLHKLESHGAKIAEITIPDLEAGRIAHTVTIASEMAQSQDAFYKDHHREYGLDVRINLALAREFTSRDYIKAQQVRSRMIGNFNRALEQVNAIITPTTGLTAPAIPKTALPDGDSDLSTLIEIMRFVTPANLTGLPAISFPAGYNDNGLPIGIQAIGKAWNEHTLLRLALAAEQSLERRAPQLHYVLLPD